MKRITAAVLGVLGCWSASAHAAVQGWVDIVDQKSVLGWACVEGDADSKLPVDLWAWSYKVSRWERITTMTANAGRVDVGNAGVCGTGTEAYYHGFEFTIYPDSMLNPLGDYWISAYVNDNGTYRALGGGGRVTFVAVGLPTSSHWRTDLDDPNARTVAMVQCIWPFRGANDRGNTDPDPLFLNAGSTITQPSWSPAPGRVSGPDWCVQHDPFDPPSWYWPASNSATNAPSWPSTNFWVVSANNEIAYSRNNSGPPSQSAPINRGDLFSVDMVGNTFTLGIDNRKPGYTTDDYPFLSLGAAMGRGRTGPLAYVEPTGQDTYVDFQVTQLAQNPGRYHDITLFVEAMWGGQKRFMGVQLSDEGALTNRFHWNWNALESFWFPGGEYNMFSTQSIAANCSLPGASLPVFTDGTIGQTRSVSIPLRALYKCVESRLIPNRHPGAGGYMGWTARTPSNQAFAITGVHLAIEHAPGEPDAYMTTRFTKPTLARR